MYPITSRGLLACDSNIFYTFLHITQFRDLIILQKKHIRNDCVNNGLFARDESPPDLTVVFLEEIKSHVSRVLIQNNGSRARHTHPSC